MSAPCFLVIASLASSLVNFRGHLLNRIAEQGFQVHAAAPGLLDDTETRRRLERMNITCHSIPLERAGLSPFGDLGTIFALVRLMRRLRCRALLAYTVKPVVYGMIAGWIARVPKRFALITGLGYAFTGEAAGHRGRLRGVVRWLYRTSLQNASQVFFQNPDDASLFRDLGVYSDGSRTTIVNGSGVDLVEFPERPLPAPPIRFLLIARLLGDKGIREYARAADELRNRHPQVEFHLVGGIDSNPDALDAREVEAWANKGQLIWHGELADVQPALEAAHVYVLPSYREGTPRTVLEAMATGRAIITTDAPGCRETVEDGVNGFLIPVGDAEALAKAMEGLLFDPDRIRKMGSRSRRIAEGKYDVHRVNQVMINAMNL